MSRDSRLIMVSNRLPATVSRNDNGEITLKASCGGVASGLASYLETLRLNGRIAAGDSSGAREVIWVGWPGEGVTGSLEQQQIRDRLKTEFSAHPVFLDEELVEGYYKGFSNATLWPLFHYFYAYARFVDTEWDAYKRANARFADAVAEIATDDDIIWVHDYQLMLVPALVRSRMPSLRIGFFLHIPFPSSELLRLLPRQWSRSLLEGLTAADVVGFHTHDYTLHFLNSVARFLGLEHNLGWLTMPNGRMVHADTFPMGIEYSSWHEAPNQQGVQNEVTRLRNALRRQRAVLSVDRLDYTKGLLQRLAAWDQFLERYPEYHGHVRLILVVVPSRESVTTYEAMKHALDERVGYINGRWGTIAWTPITYQYHPLEFQELVAHYIVSDIALLTPLRDGMNLVAKEWVACRREAKGVLILSELAGAANELGEALLINPNDSSETADAIACALGMPEAEQAKRIASMQARLQRYDVTRWADDFLTSLREEGTKADSSGPTILTEDSKSALVDAYRKARRRLILSDYDGTLVGFTEDPLDARPPTSLLATLSQLASYPNTEIALISGRQKSTLEEWFPDSCVGLVAEHGAYLRHCGFDQGQWHPLQPLHAHWKEQLRPILEMYVDRLPGSFVEEKEFCMVWHYRKADPRLGSLRARELMGSLMSFTAATPDVQVLMGNRVVELRNPNVNKGAAALWLATRFDPQPDFILALGDDWTDEDMFRSLPGSVYTIKVGTGHTSARFRLTGPPETRYLLEELGMSAQISP